MRRGPSRGKWGGKWWRPRCVSSSWRGSGWLGVALSVWLCLLTVVHLSLQPSPLLTLPPCQGQEENNPARFRGLAVAELRSTMGVVAGDRPGAAVKKDVVQRKRPEALTDNDAMGRGSPRGRSAVVGPDQRVLLTKEDSDLLVLEDDDMVGRGHRQQGGFFPDFGVWGSFGKETYEDSYDSVRSSSSWSFSDAAQETQLARTPVSRTASEKPEENQRQRTSPDFAVSPSPFDQPPGNHPKPPSPPTTHSQHLVNSQVNVPLHSPQAIVGSGHGNKSDVVDQPASPSPVNGSIETGLHSSTGQGKESWIEEQLLSPHRFPAPHRHSDSSSDEASPSSLPSGTFAVGPGAASSTPHQDPYIQNPYRQDPYLYRQNPYGQDPYGRDPYRQDPYHHRQHQHLQDPDPHASLSAKDAGTDAAQSASHWSRRVASSSASASHKTSHHHAAASHKTPHHHVAASHKIQRQIPPSDLRVSPASHVTSDGGGHAASPANHVPTKTPSSPRLQDTTTSSSARLPLSSSSSSSSSSLARGQPSGAVWRRGAAGALEVEEEEDLVAVGSRLKKDGFLEHAYNVTASDLLPLDRQVPDTRPEGCPKEWPDVTSVGPVSVIICTHNEAPSVLRRTVYSVLRQTPSHLLSDIIVVDDNTTLGDPARALKVLGDNVTQGRLRVLRTSGRQGLVRARLLGAEAARGRVLVFLDSHCECGPHWIGPLLGALRHDTHKVVSPYIDVIRSESFAYARSPDNLQGDFNWRLEFGWRAIPAEELAAREGPHLPIRTPVISGGLFAVHRQFFFDIGSYDEHMDIWGGENMELSFRVWMCGGKLEIVPCSRVGHVFRSSVPYSFPGDRRHTVLRNLARAAHVWMDEYSPFFFAAVNMTSSKEAVDVTSRVALRQRLGCRSFQWYLQTVAPHLRVPSPGARQSGQFKNRGSLLCLTSSESAGLPRLRLLACHGSLNQSVELQRSGVLQVGAACVGLSPNKQLALWPCRHTPARWTATGEQVYLNDTDLCLTSVDNEFVHLQTCRHGNPFQLWEPSYIFSWPT